MATHARPGMTSAAAAARDPVIDAVKVASLGVVISAHLLAWTVVPAGGVGNVLDAAPQLAVVTWGFQVLPLFFVVAGMGFAASIERHGTRRFLASRLVAILVPVLTLRLVSGALIALLGRLLGDNAELAGMLVVQLTWFAGVYAVLVAATPGLARLAGLGRRGTGVTAVLAIAAVGIADGTRAVAGLGWLAWANMALVWAVFVWLGMLVRRTGATCGSVSASARGWLALASVLLIGCAAVVAVFGPYSAALVSFAGAPGWSNLSPPSIVLLAVGVGQCGLLVAAWPAVAARVTTPARRRRLERVARRALHLYLWHMLVLMVLAAPLLMLFIDGRVVPPATFSAGWWGLHAVVAVGVVALVWRVAPLALRADRAIGGALVVIGRRCGAWTPPTWALVLVGVVGGVAVLLGCRQGVAAGFTLRDGTTPLLIDLVLAACVLVAGRVVDRERVA